MSHQAATGPSAAAKRELLLDAAEKVMVEQGYAGVTSRSIGATAGVPASLVHYYFPTLDDLFVAMLRRGLERSKERFLAAIRSPRPLRALWDLQLDRRSTSVTVELVALSNHRPAVREALAAMSREFQQLQVDELTDLLDRYGVDTDQFPAELAVLAIGGIARSIVREGAMGSAVGHDVALAAIDRLIDRLESPGPGPDQPPAGRPLD
jgi:AcrR family transcriptional regulator